MFEKKSKNCGLQLESIFLKFQNVQVKSFEYVNIQFHRVVGDESVN